MNKEQKQSKVMIISNKLIVNIYNIISKQIITYKSQKMQINQKIQTVPIRMLILHKGKNDMGKFDSFKTTGLNYTKRLMFMRSASKSKKQNFHLGIQNKPFQYFDQMYLRPQTCTIRNRSDYEKQKSNQQFIIKNPQLTNVTQTILNEEELKLQKNTVTYDQQEKFKLKNRFPQRKTRRALKVHSQQKNINNFIKQSRQSVDICQHLQCFKRLEHAQQKQQTKNFALRKINDKIINKKSNKTLIEKKISYDISPW